MKMRTIKKGAVALVLIAMASGFACNVFAHPHIDEISQTMSGVTPEAAAYATHYTKMRTILRDWINAQDGLSDEAYIQKFKDALSDFKAFVEKDTSADKRQLLGALCARFHMFIKSLETNKNMPAMVLGLRLKEFSDLLPAEFDSYPAAQVVDALKYRKGNR